MQLEEVYAEIRRVLKPGGLFASYEWVATKEFDPNNSEHVRIIDEINFGNGLPVSHLQPPPTTASAACPCLPCDCFDQQLTQAAALAGPLWQARAIGTAEYQVPGAGDAHLQGGRGGRPQSWHEAG